MSTIIHKKSSVAGKVPLAGDLQYGELAVNYEDEKLYYKNSAGQVKSWSRNSAVYAKASETITKGQLVMFAGSQGDHIIVSKANLSAPGFVDTWIVGVAAQNFAANDYGDVVWFGNVEGIDTSTWPLSTILYASTTPGALTSTKPTQPNHIIQIAAVTNSHATQGSLIVRPTFGSHLGDLHDVYVPNPGSNDVLIWNSSTSRWESSALKTVNGVSLLGTGDIAVSGGGSLTVATIPPASPGAGDTWVDSNSGIKYTYIDDGDSQQWVELEATTSISSGSGSGSVSIYSGEYVLTGTSVGNTETEIFIGGVANSRIPVSLNKTTYYTADIVCRRTDAAGDHAAFYLKGVATNTAGTVTDVGLVYEVVVARTDASIQVDIRANDTNDSVSVFVSGNTGKTFNWYCAITSSEV